VTLIAASFDSGLRALATRDLASALETVPTIRRLSPRR